MSSKKTFTGRVRRQRSRFSVRAADAVARAMISIGGIGTIVAVSTVFLFLLWVVAPLFFPAVVARERASEAPWAANGAASNDMARPLRVAVDEYRSIGWALYPDATLLVFRVDNGETIERQTLFENARITAVSTELGKTNVVLGLGDGTVRLGAINFDTKFYERKDVPAELRKLQVGELGTLENAVVQVTVQDQFRAQTVAPKFLEPWEVSQAQIERLDHVTLDFELRIAALDADGELFYIVADRLQDLTTDAVRYERETHRLPRVVDFGKPLPHYLLLPGIGDSLYAAWDDGRLLRLDTRKLDKVVVAERLNLLTDRGDAAGAPQRPATKVTALAHVRGRRTLVCGDDAGELWAWYRVRDKDYATVDQTRLLAVHRLPAANAAVTALGPAENSRLVAVGYDDAHLRVVHVTTRQLLADRKLPGSQGVDAAWFSPTGEGLYAATGNELWSSDFDPLHPEASLAALFLPVHYEDYAASQHKWQSTASSSEPEVKLGMWPLVSGTLKATFYSLLFGAPLALLAAIYTSEFIQPGMRAKIKSVIELMAALPSVVLGFLAAAIFAPLIETVVPSILASMFTVPVALLLGAAIWQLLPHPVALKLASLRFGLIVAAILLGLLWGWGAGPQLEKYLFDGNIILWLSGKGMNAPDGNNATGGWFILLVPISAMTVACAVGFGVNPWLRWISAPWGRGAFAAVNLMKFTLAVLAVLGLALGVAALLNILHFDPRRSFFGKYEQQNALVVGFVMGFAIIPIIYTIAEDALHAVPQHLRSASLGAGATQWQTALRIVIPTAMSGIFSALMIGLGRAVGETMIVLMAAGGTPVTDWNIFSGFRTLSATIAVELPEAALGSTHYRTLFLAALTLFLITFAVNTAAEIVRIWFRKRASRL